MPFPAVTLCNEAPVSKRALMNLASRTGTPTENDSLPLRLLLQVTRESGKKM